MDGVFPKFWAVFTQFEFFSSRFFSDSVVILPRFFADEKNRFRLLLTFFPFSHDRSPVGNKAVHYNPSGGIGKTGTLP